ncbi:AAA family ATPase [Streptomyces laculatispora]|uniref:AAA family ATPase n=1 Tax=Streptomyces laculatispora TaxID=887464 RepID=UPI001A946422|nr:AAA family ATPase [Streptomyces laculatispora]MBO0915539.1 AAA family ATPase [Streptomyces laculatispora]
MTTTNPATTGPVLHPDLTPAQRDCLDALPLTGNHLVSGPPGSGKSLLAAHRAVHLALTGRPTVLLTRSKLLCRLLQATLDDLTVPGAAIEASTAHAWIMRRYGRGAVRTADGWFDWTELTGLAAATIDASETTVTPHLVVDEGQDLPPGFYRMVRLTAVSTTVFADECQRLTETNSTLNEIASTLGHSTSRVEISGNHRNTREIASLAEHFRVGGTQPDMPVRSGTLPAIRRYSGPKDLADDIAGLALRAPKQRIGVIVNSLPTAADLMRRLERANLPTEPQLYSSAAQSDRYRNLDLTRPGVVFVHRASAKGLGFDTVVVADAETDSAADPTEASLRMAYYVMITRARQRLILGWQGSRLPRHLEGLGGWATMR